MVRKFLWVMLILSLSFSVLANIDFRFGIVGVYAVPFDATLRAWCYGEPLGKELISVDIYSGGSTVALGDADVGYALVNFVSTISPYERHRENIANNSVYDSREYIYQDLNNPAGSAVSIGDIRLTAVPRPDPNDPPYSAGSTVASGDADVGYALVYFVSAVSPFERHREEVTANGVYDGGEHVYQDANDPAGSTTSVGDVRPMAYTTPYTFTGLTAPSYTFTVPASDSNAHAFTRWSDGVTTTTSITVNAAGTYVAYYSSYFAYVKAKDLTLLTDEVVTITVVNQTGTFPGFSTPFNFTRRTGPHTFTVPVTSPDNHPLAYNSWFETGTLISETVSVDVPGNYTAQYAAYTIAARYSNGTGATVNVTRSGDLTVYNTPKTFFNIAGSQFFTVGNVTSEGIPFKQWEPPYSEITEPTLSVARGLMYTAIYEAFSVKIDAYSRTLGSSVGVSVKVDDNPIWYTTPHNFTNLAGTRTFTVASLDPSNNPFAEWDTGVTSASLTVLPWLRRPSYTAYYEAITVKAFSYASNQPVNVRINFQNGTWTGFTTPHTFAGWVPPLNFSVPSLDPNGHAFQWWGHGGSRTNATITRGGNFTAFYRLPPLVYVDPPYVQGSQNSTVWVSVKIYNLTDGWLWNPSKTPPVYEPLGNLYSVAMKMNYDQFLLEYLSKDVRIPVATYSGDRDGILYGPATKNSENPITENFVTSLAISGSYLYAGLAPSTGPGKIWKIRLTDWVPLSTLTLDAGEKMVSSLTVNGSYLYAGLSTVPGKIVKIDLGTFTKVSTLTLPNVYNAGTTVAAGNVDLALTLIAFKSAVIPYERHRENVATNGLYDIGEYIYKDSNLPAQSQVSVGDVRLTPVGSYAAGSSVVSGDSDIGFSLVNFASNEKHAENIAITGTVYDVGEYIYRDIDNNNAVSAGDLRLREVDESLVSSLVVGGSPSYLYAGLDTLPGKVVRITPAFLKDSSLALVSGESKVKALIISGTDLYAGCYVSPGKVVKIALGTFTRTGVVTFPTNENQVTSLAVSGLYLYAGLSTGGLTTNGRVARITLSSFAQSGTVLSTDSNEDFVNALAVSGSYLYAGCAPTTGPSRIMKIDLNTFQRTAGLPLSSVPPVESDLRALVASGTTDLYAGLETQPGRVVKVNLGTFLRDSGMARYIPPFSLSAQSTLNTTSGKWPYPYNNDSVTVHPTIYRIQFRILKANTIIPLSLSEIVLTVPPSGWADPVTGEQKYNRQDISNIIMHTKAFDHNDLVALWTAFGSTPLTPNWNVNYDFDRDNIIGVQDLNALSRYFGRRT